MLEHLPWEVKLPFLYFLVNLKNENIVFYIETI